MKFAAMKLYCALAALSLSASAFAPAFALGPAKVRDESFRDTEGQRVLQQSMVVNAKAATVWQAFTTDAGFMRWAVPVAHITPGNGGLIEFAATPDGKLGDPNNIRNRIDVYLPQRLLVMHNEFVPAGGPMDPATFASVHTLIELEPLHANKTRVTQTVVGFGSTPQYDALYAHLHDGNAAYLMSLAKSFGEE
jgi:uncharacterized protein YndB with AHSA1/START domain